MCDYREYSIVAPEHCVLVPKPYPVENYRRTTVLCFQTHHTSWQFNINYYSNYIVNGIEIKNIHGPPVNQSEENEPLAEIAIWRWKNNEQEIIKKELFNGKENKTVFSPNQLDIFKYDVDDVHFTIRLIEKRKEANDLCPPLYASDAFTISVGDQNFVVSVHRLMQISPVFRAMLTDEMREKAERKVEVKDAEPEHFRAFLEVIDPDQKFQPNPHNVVGVLELAHYYEVKLAKDRCEELLTNCVELTISERLQLADTYGLNKLKDWILSIGPVKLRTLYKANAEKFKKGQFSMELLHDLFSRICDNE